MTAKASGSNSPLHKREHKALVRRDALVKKLVGEDGLSKEEAIARAQETMSDNSRHDWRAG